MADLPGYRLLELLRSGRTCEVHRAVRVDDAAPVIIKRLPPGRYDAKVAARLEREYAISRELHAPGLRRAVGLLESAAGPVLVFPDPGGVTLRQLLDAAPLSLFHAVRIAEGAAEALAQLHALGWLHRDIKPGNFLVAPERAQVQLIDFGLAERLDLAADAASASPVEGTPAYMAPEQTGRINRPVDVRSDLYSFGITLYEMLCGRRPFQGDDAVELMHRHIVELPLPPSQLDPRVPPALSALVMKLLAKDPQDRYQSAAGLVHDLKLIGERLRAGGSVADLALGRRDRVTRLSFPSRLYGREGELGQLVAAAGRVAQGGAELWRLSGSSGVGKSALIDALCAQLGRDRVLLVRGKFDQYSREQPYSAVLEGLSELLRLLLRAEASEAEHWRERISSALAPNTQVLIDLLPEFEHLLGPQPPATPLPAQEAQYRFGLVMRRFLRALATPRQPLLLFLDDLQWADPASRALLRTWLTDRELSHVLVIGAFREREVGPQHPLTALWAELATTGLGGGELRLAPLSLEAINAWLADTLDAPLGEVEPLGALVARKTRGNPFFMRQFLADLVRKELLWRSEGEAWQWALQRIALQHTTDNVVELVSERLHALPANCLQLVQIAACIGNRFDLRTLAEVARLDVEAAFAALQPALAADVLLADALAVAPLLTASSAAFRFQHDRVQQAAHATLDEAQRAATHLAIGRVLLAAQAGHPDERLAEVVAHFDAAIDQLDERERLPVARLNLLAAAQARAATAWDAASRYLKTAEQLLGEDAWDVAPQLALEVQLASAEAEYLGDRFDAAVAIAERLLQRPLVMLDRARALQLLVVVHSARLDYTRALDAGCAALKELGSPLPARPPLLGTLLALGRARFNLPRQPGVDLAQRPPLVDVREAAILQALMLIAPPAYFRSPRLLPLIAERMVQISLHHGQAPASAFGYAVYGMLQCSVFGDFRAGLAWGKLALHCTEHPGSASIRARVLLIHAGFIQHWSARLTDTLPAFLEGADAALEAGDIEHHGYLRYCHAAYAFIAGVPLPRVAELIEHHLQAVLEHAHEKTERILRLAQQTVRRLRGLPPIGDAHWIDEADAEAIWQRQNNSTSLAYLGKYRMLRALMEGDYAAVLQHCRSMRRYRAGIRGMAFVPYYLFYQALALIVTAADADRARRGLQLLHAQAILRRLRRWARSAPFNLGHRVTLLCAELRAVRGRRGALVLFEQAIREANEHRALHDEALASERAGEHLLRRGALTAARAHFAHAMACYRAWGADGWAKALAARHAELLRENPELAPDQLATLSDDDSLVERFDVASFIHSARAISEQLSLDAVVGEVMRAAVLDAGARRGVLLLGQGESLAVQAEFRAEGGARVRTGTALAPDKPLPGGIIRYVARARQTVLIDEARLDPVFGDDPYVREQQPRSILCVPLQRKGELIGVVYLEHELSRGVFNPARARAIEMLCAQAAIAVENARLYDQLRGALQRQVELTGAHARFVPHQFLETLGRREITDVALGDHSRIEASVLFSDLRGFTGLIEQLDPHAAIEFINAYLAQMEPAIQAASGFVDSYVGDGIMAVFPKGADSAVAAAVDMQRRLERWNRARQDDLGAVRMGIGIASGEIMLGTIGSPGRIKCGVIGDSVNLASRVEGLTKQYRLSLLITDGTYARLQHPERFLIREVDCVKVVGRQQPVRLYEVFDADPDRLKSEKLGSRDALANALAAYRAGDLVRALTLFELCAANAPADPLIPLYRQRCRDYLAHVGPSWDGVEKLLQK